MTCFCKVIVSCGLRDKNYGPTKQLRSNSNHTASDLSLLEAHCCADQSSVWGTQAVGRPAVPWDFLCFPLCPSDTDLVSVLSPFPSSLSFCSKAGLGLACALSLCVIFRNCPSQCSVTVKGTMTMATHLKREHLIVACAHWQTWC